MKGLYVRNTNRNTKEFITKDPNIIAQRVLGDKATEKDLFNIPALVSYLKRQYSEEEVQRMVADAEKTIGASIV